MLRPEPHDRARLVEITENLEVRIAEAEREGWLGGAENLTVSLSATRGEIDELDAAVARTRRAVHLGMPTFAQIAGRPND